MSEAARHLFSPISTRELMGDLKAFFNNIVIDVGNTVDQKNVQAASELASALFSGHVGYVPYGPGQNPVSPEHGPQQGFEQVHELGHER